MEMSEATIDSVLGTVESLKAVSIQISVFHEQLSTD